MLVAVAVVGLMYLGVAERHKERAKGRGVRDLVLLQRLHDRHPPPGLVLEHKSSGTQDSSGRVAGSGPPLSLSPLRGVPLPLPQVCSVHVLSLSLKHTNAPASSV
jgi:hypothetical protein